MGDKAQEGVEELLQQFPRGLADSCRVVGCPFLIEWDTPWTVDSFLAAAARLKPDGAPGPSGLRVAHLAQLPDSGLRLIVALCNCILRTGAWPASWKHGLICPIPKGSGSTAWEDMRPITLLEIPVKVMTRHWLELCLPELLEQRCIQPEQAGFIAGRDAGEHLGSDTNI